MRRKSFIRRILMSSVLAPALAFMACTKGDNKEAGRKGGKASQSGETDADSNPSPGSGEDAGNNTDTDSTTPTPPKSGKNADAGPDQKGAVGVGVSLHNFGDAAKTTTHQWTLISSPQGSAAKIADSAAKSTAFVPDIEGSYVVKLSVAGEEDEVNINVVATGPFQVVHGGSGLIDDFSFTDKAHFIPIEKRVHVVMFAEGYTAADMEKGTFDKDIKRWMDETFIIEPYSLFKEAFVVWKLPTASQERVGEGSPQPNNTIYKVPIEADESVGTIELTGPTSQAVWQSLAKFPFPPGDFYPQSGNNAYRAKNLIAVMHILNPTHGRSTFSGVSRRLENPANAEQRISTAFALNYPHEFTHAFSTLDDEYLREGSGGDKAFPAHSGNLTNVVGSNKCSELPWRHLLPGGSINAGTAELVGAFGFADTGYHSEFKCLLNGSHDNKQYYGGDGNLRSKDRMCNFCREVTVFRLLERVGILADVKTSYQKWEESYRAPFYKRYGFQTPDVIPQQSSDGKAWYQTCVQ